jgi:hypothetical protein
MRWKVLLCLQALNYIFFIEKNVGHQLTRCPTNGKFAEKTHLMCPNRTSTI